MAEAQGIQREDLRAARRRAHRIRIESRSRALEKPLAAWLERRELREVHRQLDVLGLPRPVAKAAPGILSNEERDQLGDLLAGFGVQQAVDAGEDATRALSGETFAIPHQLELAVLEYASVELGQIGEELRGRVERLVRGVTEQALSEFPRPGPEEIAAQVLRELRDEGGGVREAVARDVSRRFTNFAVNRGTMEGFKQAGVVEHEWLAINDARSRDSHGGDGPNRADGMRVPIGRPFIFTGLRGGLVAMLHPGSIEGPPEERRWCRCALMPVR